MVRVPVEVFPPTRVVGLRLRVATMAGLTVNIPVEDVPPTVAVIVTAVDVVTGVVVNVK